MGLLRGRLGRLRDEDGFSLAEVMVALTIIAVGFLGLATTASTGARMLAEARQRQAATEIANRELEHIRNIPYDDVALTGALTKSTDPDDPDFHVSVDGLGYDHDKNASDDLLVIDADGLISHLEETNVGPTLLRIYRYVTWVDDPNVTGMQDYKRLTLIAYFRAPVNTGRPREVRVSALFTPGTVIVEGEDASGTTGSSSTPAPTPSPTPSGSCAGDTTAPGGTFTILSGTGAATGFTASTTVTIQLSPSDSCTPITIAFSNDSTNWGTAVTYDESNPTATWVLTSGDGVKNVWARFTDGVGNASVKGPKAITLDRTPPTVPGTLARSISCSGNNRTVNLSWASSTDANLIGYRVYRSVDNQEYAVLAQVSTLTRSDTHQKNLDSVRYYVVGYDKAGNESDATNVISLAKNQCS